MTEFNETRMTSLGGEKNDFLNLKKNITFTVYFRLPPAWVALGPEMESIGWKWGSSSELWLTLFYGDQMHDADFHMQDAF